MAHRGLHAWQVYDINQPTVGALQANPGVNVNALRPYKGFAAIQEEESGVSSTYNSLQISWSRAFKGGSSFGVTYTYSKSMDGGSNYRDIVPDTYNTSNMWGPSEYDDRHVVILNYIYDLPFFKGQRNMAEKMLGGWEIAGTAQFQTGTPCGIGTNADFAGAGEYGSFGLRLRRPVLEPQRHAADQYRRLRRTGHHFVFAQVFHRQCDATGRRYFQPARPASATRFTSLASRIGTSPC